jgi:hypothetical protein
MTSTAAVLEINLITVMLKFKLLVLGHVFFVDVLSLAFFLPPFNT